MFLVRTSATNLQSKPSCDTTSQTGPALSRTCDSWPPSAASVSPESCICKQFVGVAQWLERSIRCCGVCSDVGSIPTTNTFCLERPWRDEDCKQQQLSRRTQLQRTRDDPTVGPLLRGYLMKTVSPLTNPSQVLHMISKHHVHQEKPEPVRQLPILFSG